MFLVPPFRLQKTEYAIYHRLLQSQLSPSGGCKIECRCKALHQHKHKALCLCSVKSAAVRSYSSLSLPHRPAQRLHHSLYSMSTHNTVNNTVNNTERHVTQTERQVSSPERSCLVVTDGNLLIPRGLKCQKRQCECVCVCV